MPYDDLHCSFDKVPRCVELGIHVLVDDSPVNIAKARAAGHRGAPRSSIPGTRRSSTTDGVIGAPRLARLKAALDPVLERLDPAPA